MGKDVIRADSQGLCEYSQSQRTFRPTQASRVTCHAPPITHSPFPITHYPFPITHYRSPVTRHPSPQHGFTLIEILVVTVILGIGLALAVANLQPDDRQAAQREARGLMHTIELLQDRAVIGGEALAVSFGPQGAVLWGRNDRGEWQETTVADAKFRKADLTVTALKLGATSAANDARIVFLPEGVGVPFELTVSHRNHSAVINGDALGKLTLKALDS